MDKTEMYQRNTSALTWQKSTLTIDQPTKNNCVQVARFDDGVVAIGDSNRPGAPALMFTPGEAAAFIGGVKNGEFDHLL
jgi:hypothetical protein